MPTWLDSAQVTAVLGSDLAEAVDTTALQQFCDAARAYVEDQRSDLFAEYDDDGDGVVDRRVYEPTSDVTVGAALLAYRWYTRRTSPLGVIGATEDNRSGILRHDPDIARLLGIGLEGAFRFGVGRAPTTEV